MNNLPKVVTQQRRGRASNPRLLDRKSDALPLSHRATLVGKQVCLLAWPEKNVVAATSHTIMSVYGLLATFRVKLATDPTRHMQPTRPCNCQQLAALFYITVGLFLSIFMPLPQPAAVALFSPCPSRYSSRCVSRDISRASPLHSRANMDSPV